MLRCQFRLGLAWQAMFGLPMLGLAVLGMAGVEWRGRERNCASLNGRHGLEVPCPDMKGVVLRGWAGNALTGAVTAEWCG